MDSYTGISIVEKNTYAAQNINSKIQEYLNRAEYLKTIVEGIFQVALYSRKKESQEGEGTCWRKR